MSKPLLGLGLIVFCLTSCNKKTENLGQIKYDSQARTSKEIHDYTYDEKGNVLTDIEVVYDFINEKVMDTTHTTSQYKYDKGKLIEIDIQSDVPALSETRLYKYNL